MAQKQKSKAARKRKTAKSPVKKGGNSKSPTPAIPGSGSPRPGKTAKIGSGLTWSMYRKMWEIRKFEEHVWDVYTRGLMPGLAHLYIGEEGVAVGACSALGEEDYITSTHRGHGHCLAKGAALDRMMAEIMGKEAGYCRGKGGSMHIADFSGGNLGANGIVGGSFGIATGAALSAKMRGSGQVAVCFFGDGAANQGILLETVNMAVIWSLPVIYICENNQYGEHTPFEKVTGVDQIVKRAAGLGLEGVRLDGSDVVEMYTGVSEAVEKARSGNGPTFIEADTYRYRGHHVGDAAGYRTREELDWWMQNKDPIHRLGEQMIAWKMATRSELEALENQVEDEVVEAVEFGRNSELPPPEQAFEDIYA